MRYLLLGAVILGGCSTMTDIKAADSGLAGSNWQLVQFQSSDDSIGTIRPDDPARYTMELGAEGRLAMRLDCNRATGRWSATQSSPGTASGAFTLSPTAMTRAMCPPGSMDTRIARDSAFIRSYVLEGDMLNLALQADGGIYTWRRVNAE